MTVNMLRRLAVLLLVGGILILVPVSPADEKKTTEEKEPEKMVELTPEEKVIEEVASAYKLAEFGRKNNAPEALIAAGTILRSLKGTKLGKITEEPKVEGGEKSEEVPAKSFEEQAGELFDEASTIGLMKKIAGVDSLIKAAKDREFRNVIGGPKTVRRTIGRGQTHTFHFNVQPNKNTSFGFQASFPMLISIVRSDNDFVIANGVTGGAVIHHHFGGVRKGGKVIATIRIKNVGRQAGSYQLFAS